MPSKLLTAIDVATILSFSVGYIYTLVRRGEIPAIRIGRRVRFDPDALKRWLEQDLKK